MLCWLNLSPWMTLSVYSLVGWSTNLIQAELSKPMLHALWKFCADIHGPQWVNLTDLVIPWLFLYCHCGLTFAVRSHKSQQLLDGLPWNLAQTRFSTFKRKCNSVVFIIFWSNFSLDSSLVYGCRLLLLYLHIFNGLLLYIKVLCGYGLKFSGTVKLKLLTSIFIACWHLCDFVIHSDSK